MRYGPDIPSPAAPVLPRARVATLLIAVLATLPACGRVEATAPARSPASLTGTPTAGPRVALITGPADQGHELLGAPAPSLEGVRWLDGEEHPLAEDRGRPVLIRWWTDTCPFCVNSAPALRNLAERFGDALVVRAIYHEKPPGRPVSDTSVRAAAERLGLPFLLGRDDQWGALSRWWLDAGGRTYTSVTFLVDAEGSIAAIHTGTEFHGDEITAADCARHPDSCHAERDALERAIGDLLTPEG